MKSKLRRIVRWMHLWLGLVGGAFICLMGFTGGLVGIRPQLALLLAPAPAHTATCAAPDWNRAGEDIATFGKADINRVYGPYDSDPRWHVRMATDDPILFGHVIYDACAGKVLGSINYQWMDWTVDLHHNLLNGRVGRRWAGAIGILMLISGLSGLLYWLLGRPDPAKAFRVRFSLTRRTPGELHRAFGLLAAVLLTLEAATGAALAFPQTIRDMVSAVSPIAADIRPPRGPAGERKESATRATLGDLMAAAHSAIPDGLVREIRMPEGNGNATIRMWREGDFRILGNNVVYVSGSTGKVLAVERYDSRPPANRFIQGMAALHYDEWGGMTFRLLSCVAGLATPLLYITGILIWLYSRKRKVSGTAAQAVEEATAALTR